MNSAAGERVAVSLTPLPLAADSRALRIARTLAEIGFRSIVVEGRESPRRFWGTEIEVRPIARRAPGVQPGSLLRPGPLRNAVTAVRQGRLGAIGDGVLYGGFRAYDWWRNARRPRRLVPAAELYVLHSFELYRAVAPLARRSSARILYDAHDFYRGMEPPERQAAFDRSRLQPYLRRLEDRLAGEADAMTTVSGGIASLMSKAFGRRPEVIRNCHDERYDRRAARPLRDWLGLGAADRLAVVVGNYKRGRAVGVAAAALARLPENYHLAFLGRGYEAVGNELPADVVGKRLHVGLVVAPDEIVPTIRSADLGLVIYDASSENYRSSLPNGFFQLIAAGLPVVRPPLPEIEATIGGRAVGRCLARLEPEELARAMTHCAEGRDRLRGNVAELARGLRWEEEAGRLKRLIEGLLACEAGQEAAARASDRNRRFLEQH